MGVLLVKVEVSFLKVEVPFLKVDVPILKVEHRREAFGFLLGVVIGTSYSKYVSYFVLKA